VPPPGTILHIAGQSREELADYIATVCAHGREAPLPAGASFYTSLALTGIERAHANVAGDHHQDLRYIAALEEPLVVLVGLWLGADELRAIAAGGLDGAIDRLASALDALERPVYVRIGYEFDGPHNRYDPFAYQEAYRHIVRRMRARAPRHIAFVWHSYALRPTYGDRDVLTWFPGDEFVDWIGVSFFEVGEPGLPPAPNRERVLEVARRKAKPVMVCEASAIRRTPAQKRLRGDAYWEYWYAPFFEFVERNPEVRAFAIISCDWDSQRQHRDNGWGDARIGADPRVVERWRAKMREPRFLHTAPRLYGMLGTGAGLEVDRPF
jgi:hypothetical protein